MSQIRWWTDAVGNLWSRGQVKGRQIFIHGREMRLAAVESDRLVWWHMASRHFPISEISSYLVPRHGIQTQCNQMEGSDGRVR